MQAALLDRYQEGRSIIHQLDPRVKLVVVFGFILSNLLLPDGAWVAFGLSLLFMVWVSQASGLGWFFVFKRSLLALPFVLAAVTIMFTLPGDPGPPSAHRQTVGPPGFHVNSTASKMDPRFLDRGTSR